jgi:predicted DNA-binding transcriptional regulator AlpA
VTHHLVGMAEIAEMLGVTRQRVAQLIESYDDFPAPEVELTAGRIWSRTAIETWIASHPERRSGRPEGGKPKRRFFGGWPAMFHRFTDRARTAIVLAQEQARLLHHNYIGTEHLLLGLSALGEGVAYEVLVSLGAAQDDIRDGVLDMIGEGVEDPKGHIPFTPRAKKVLELALREAIALNHNYIGTEHVLLALVREKDGVAWKVLAKCGLKQKSTREAILQTLSGLGVTTAVETEVGDRLTELEERLRRLEAREKEE